MNFFPTIIYLFIAFATFGFIAIGTFVFFLRREMRLRKTAESKPTKLKP